MKRTIVLLMALILLFGCGKQEIFDYQDDGDENDYVIVRTDQVETEVYHNNDFSITIPKGWIVTYAGYNIYHTIRVYDPNEPLNQMFVLLKAEPLFHCEEGKQAWIAQGGTSAIIGGAPVLYNPSTEGFYQTFNEFIDFITNADNTYYGYEFPNFGNFNVIETYPSNSSLSAYAYGDSLLRGTFSADGKEGEGLFAASVCDFGSFPIGTGNVNNYVLEQVDGGYYMVYNIIAITTVKDSFIDYESLLSKCMSSLEYSSSFVAATNQASNEKVALAMQISKNFNEVMDGFMSSWENRNRSFDIMSQKQSDAILGYERVYDTDTNEIYKATNGFMDVYDEDRFKPITEDMYSEPISGYIEKQ